MKPENPVFTSESTKIDASYFLFTFNALLFTDGIFRAGKRFYIERYKNYACINLNDLDCEHILLSYIAESESKIYILLEIKLSKC